MQKGVSVLIDACLKSEGFEAYADTLTKVERVSPRKYHYYIPVLVIGTYKVSKEQKLRLGFISYVLSKVQKERPASGTILGEGNKPHKIKLEPIYKEIESIIKELTTWLVSHPPKPPPIILNKHCPLCPFQQECEEKAKKPTT